VVRAAETKKLLEIGGELRELVERARTRRLEKAEMEGGTFTVSNLGAFGIKSFTSVLNPPQACILSVGAAETRPIFGDTGFVVATLTTVTLTCDHRVVDGVTGARFLAAFKALLENIPR
jgi:pyruvate dehydrogenase E2 component (dihydrolipoamide acetyltransferase)